MNIHCRYDKLVPVKELKPHSKNRNKHPKEQIERLSRILSYQGIRAPIVVADAPFNCIAKGHGTLDAIKHNGWKEAPVVYQKFDSEEQLYAFVQSDNAIANWAELDLSGINLDLPDLGPDFDIDMLGIKDFTLDAAEKEGLTDPDEVPEVGDGENRVKLGELWQLGNHRLMCGDSTVRENVERLMVGEKAKAWITDPPYGINHVEVSQEKGQSKGYKKIENDELEDKALQEFIFKAIEASKPFLEENFAFYMWHAMTMQGYFAAAAAAGILFHRQIIWVKERTVFGRGHYHWQHELCLMGWLQGNEPPFYGERNQSTIWKVSRENDKIHPTQKPVELYEIPIKNHLKNGEIFMEPFGGSGSGFIAAEKTNRKCYGLEISPHYADVILARWEKFTGKKAVKTN